MSWQSENSVKRIFNTFKRLKTQIFNQDIEALKQLNNELILTQKSYVNDNILFGKLLCYVLDKNLHQNGDIKASIKIASDILKEPLDYHLQLFQKNLNNKDLENYFLSLGFNLDHLNFEDNNEQIITDNQKEIVNKIKTNWTFENVEKSFYNTANDFLKETDNYL